MSGEYTVCHRQGRQIPVEFRAVANILPGQHLSILRDVSRLRQAQADMHLYQRDKRAQAAKTLYSVLDMLVAAKIGLNSESSWRRALIGQAKRELGSEINEAIAGLRKALASLETTETLGR